MGGDRHAQAKPAAARKPDRSRQHPATIGAAHVELPKKGFGYEKEKNHCRRPMRPRPKTRVSQAPMRSSYRIRIASSLTACRCNSRSQDSADSWIHSPEGVDMIREMLGPATKIRHAVLFLPRVG